MSRLTLCLIARDEEQMLPACLASVRGVVDRIVAADTGSTDKTRAILHAAGAEVFDFAWRDDFAAARNAVLERVHDGHVLVLDADERLAGGAGRVLRAALKSGSKRELDCGLLPLHHASTLDASEADVLSGRKRLVEPVLLPRLLRRAKDLRWEGVVHENVGTWLARPGRAIRTLDAPIVHYGAVPEWRAARGKRERNLALLEARCAAEPEDPTPRAYLVNELLRIGERARARSEIERALELARAARARGVPLDPTHVLTLHAYTLLTSGELDAASASLDLARDWQCKHPNFDFLTGALLEHRASAAARTDAGRPDAGRPGAELLERAALHLERALAAHSTLWPAETLPGATSFAAALRLGQVRLAQLRTQEALAAFDRVLAEQPDNTQARLGRIEALIAGGHPDRALGELEPLLASAGADGWLVAAWAARELGQTADARAFSETAARLAPNGAPRSARWARVARALAAAA
ncbi:MAG: tetratricopeptide repeat protein [Planctomycetota bacterium]|nr:MAG: tetratricopeptide repeat protein [Planctomycetota bacterium]